MLAILFADLLFLAIPSTISPILNIDNITKKYVSKICSIFPFILKFQNTFSTINIKAKDITEYIV